MGPRGEENFDSLFSHRIPAAGRIRVVEVRSVGGADQRYAARERLSLIGGYRIQSLEASILHDMRQGNAQARDCLLYTSRCV